MKSLKIEKGTYADSGGETTEWLSIDGVKLCSYDLYCEQQRHSAGLLRRYGVLVKLSLCISSAALVLSVFTLISLLTHW